jgi:competence protein ComEC
MRTPLFLSAVIFMISLIISHFFDASSHFFLLFLAVGTVLFILLWRLRLARYFFIFGLIFTLGFGYGEYREWLIPENPFADGENVSVSGLVINDPVKTDQSVKCNFSVLAINGEALNKPVNIIVLASSDSDLTYGDEVTVTGDFLTSKVANPGGFDYAVYLEQRSLYGVLSALYGGSITVESTGNGHFALKAAYWLKHRFEASLAYLPEDQRMIINGIFFGDTSSIDQSTSDILTKSGIRHCFAVSGLHVGYIVLFLAMLAGLLKFGRGRKILLMIPCLFLYAAMTGFSASVLRATVMCLMIYGADLFGREKNGFNGLATAALLILIWDPLALFQVGFQLSFVAMFSILFVTPWLHHLVKKDFPGKSALLITVAAQIGVMPILAYYFHVVSFVSLLISTVCCLMVGGMVILCFAALIFAVFWPPLGALFLIPCGVLGALIIKGVTAASALPFAYIFKGSFSIWILLLMYVVIAVIILLPWLKYRKVLSAFLLCASFALFLLPLGQNRDALQITILSVGEGDAIYIHTPAGEDMMMDACDKGNNTEVSYIIRPFLLYQGVNHIDRMMLSHNDIDHSGGVFYLNEFFGISSYVLAEAASYTYDDISAQAVADGSTVAWVSTGDIIDLGNDTTLEILYPDAEENAYGNELSMVARLSYGDFSMLFTGDLEDGGIAALLSSGQDIGADILKIPHHGSQYSYDEEFYQAVSPKSVVISVGKNSYGHPYEGIIDYCNDREIGCFRTDLDGAVTVISDGSGYEITTYVGGQ